MAISLQDISFHHIIQNVQATFLPGELVALIGPNGAGKSTILRMMAGVLRPTQGAILLDGAKINALHRRERAKRIAFMPQQIAQEITFTVREFIAMGLYAHRNPLGGLSSLLRTRVDEVMHSLALERYADVVLHQLSGGERQRVAIARCLAQGSDNILLDEPIANLDIAHQLDTMEILADLAKHGHLVVISIHDLELAARYASKMYVVHQGKIVREGVAQDVIDPVMLQEVFQVDAMTYYEQENETLRVHAKKSLIMPTR